MTRLNVVDMLDWKKKVTTRKLVEELDWVSFKKNLKNLLLNVILCKQKSEMRFKIIRPMENKRPKFKH